MPTVDLEIAGRNYAVACDEGQEESLKKAAAHLDDEAQKLIASLGRLPDDRLNMMAGLMIADRIAYLDNALAAAEDKLEQAQAELEFMHSRPAPEAKQTIPDEVYDLLEKVVTEIESVTDQAENSD